MRHQHSYISGTKLFQIIVLSLLSILIIDFLLSLFMKRMFDDSNTEVRNVLNKTNANLIILGSSTVSRGINPEIIDRNLNTKSYSFASDGTGIFYALGILRQVPLDSNLEYVIFGIDPQSFVTGYKSSNFKQIERLLPYAISDKIVMDFISHEKDWLSVKMISRSYPYVANFKEIIKNILRNKILNNEYYDEYNFRPLNGTIINKNDYQKIGDNKIEESGVLNISDEGVYLLDLLSKELIDRDLKLIITTLPVYNTKLRSNQQKYSEVMNVIKNKLQKVNLCDLSQLEDVNILNITDEVSNFYDGPHLNSVGAKSFSKYLSNRVINNCNFQFFLK